MFEKAIKSVGESHVYEKVDRYNQIVRKAPARLYDLYVCLYVENHTQESLSEHLGYTPEYIQMLNKELLKYLLAQMSA